MPNFKFQISNFKSQKGFTLMEIIVATTIFAVVTAAMMALFNYVLKINRKSEALRQATQGMRSFVEFVTKEIRNGQIDYLVVNGTSQSPSSPLGPCVAPAVNNGTSPPTVSSTYAEKENKIAIINSEGQEECIYFSASDSNKTYKGVGVFEDISGGALVLQRAGVEKQFLSPDNVKVNQLAFFIRPICDPYAPRCADYSNDLPKIQPMVMLNIKFTARLSTGESKEIYYQTSVTTNKYDIPNQ